MSDYPDADATDWVAVAGGVGAVLLMVAFVAWIVGWI